MIRQAKGKKHCKNIKRKAMRLWKRIDFQQGMFFECIRQALSNHRKRIAEDMEKQRLGFIESTHKKEDGKQEEMDLTTHGWIG